jgi:hypothetical protein
MKEKQVTMFHCDYCSKYLQVKSAMVHHENTCNKNPENRVACEGCDYLEQTTTIIEYGDNYFNEPIEGKSNAFKCTHPLINKMVYPVKVLRLKLPQKHPYTFQDQIRMPKECEYRTPFKYENHD